MITKEYFCQESLYMYLWPNTVASLLYEADALGIFTFISTSYVYIVDLHENCIMSDLHVP